jgi:hypothetical protein
MDKSRIVIVIWTLFGACFLACSCFLFDLVDGGEMFLRNTGFYLYYPELQARRSFVYSHLCEKLGSKKLCRRYMQP